MTRPLTPREKEIARHWLAGNEHRVIAQILGIKRPTVSVTIKRLRHQLGVSPTEHARFTDLLRKHLKA
jgi:DNA-binding CsgD family transcriptional regulator